MATTMAKKKTSETAGPGPGKDRHKATRMVRVPDDWHDALKGLARQNRRPLTWELLLALEAHLKANGVEPPPMPG